MNKVNGYGDSVAGRVAVGPVGDGSAVNVGLVEGVGVTLGVSVGAGVLVMVDDGCGIGVSVVVEVGVKVSVDVGVKVGGSVGTTEVGVNVGKSRGVGSASKASGSCGAGPKRLMTTKIIVPAVNSKKAMLMRL